MTLQAIIIRAEGSLAETEDVRWKAFAQVFSEAGFDWSCDREGFALTAKFGSAETRMAHYVRGQLRGRRESEDFSLLIQAMHRRASNIFGDMLAGTAIEPRPGIRELIVAAKAEDLRLVLVSLLDKDDVASLMATVFGERGRELFDTVLTHPDGGSDACKKLYQETKDTLGLGLDHCVVIEAGRAGAEAAREIGFPVLTTRSAFCPESVVSRSGALVIEDLTRLLPARDPRRRHDPLSADERSELLTTLQRLHAGNCECLVDQDWSDHMRVSDILKAKGSAVKTIDLNATMRSFAHSLKTEIVGAMLVIDASGALQGIISERDLASGIDEYGPDLPQMRVANLMTRSVVTCAPEDSLATVANIMTERRIRHLPVMVSGAVVGLISIGDVLKHRLDEVQLEANVLRDVALVRR